MGQDTWAPLADKFLGYYGTIQGRVRTHLIDRNLRYHLAAAPAEVIDVGGGAGHQALPLARAGYRVTIVDPSAAMLGQAAEMISGEPEEVQSRVTLVNAVGEDAFAAAGGRRFAAVLCHGVLQYLDDPLPLLSSLAELADDGGVLSVVPKNQRAVALQLALAGDSAAALSALGSDRQVRGIGGVQTRSDTVEGLGDWLARRGVETVASYGVGFFTDWWGSERSADHADNDLLALELEASRRDPYRQLGRMFHLIGVRHRGAPED